MILVTLIICLTVLGSVYMLTQPVITIVHKTPVDNTAPITQEDLDKALKQDTDPAPSFEDVINVINREFGGVDYDE